MTDTGPRDFFDLVPGLDLAGGLDPLWHRHRRMLVAGQQPHTCGVCMQPVPQPLHEAAFRVPWPGTNSGQAITNSVGQPDVLAS